MIVGISGKIAAGKSVLAQSILQSEQFEDAGEIIKFSAAQLFEIDALAHDLYADDAVRAEIYNAFGAEVFDGFAVSRPKLSHVVFSDSALLTVLEQILHPLMRRIISMKVKDARANETNLLLVAALPLSFHFDELCDRVIDIPINKETAWRRVLVRNPDFSSTAFEVIWARQACEYACSLAKKEGE